MCTRVIDLTCLARTSPPGCLGHAVEDMERPALACYDRQSGVPGVTGTIAGYYRR